MNAQHDNSREQTLLAARKQIISSAFLALAALGVIVFACYAWFAASGSVIGQIGYISPSHGSFELASVGEKGPLDYILSDRAADGEDWTEPSGIPGTSTIQNNDIFWRVSNTSSIVSHFGNQTAESGIYPGASGTLQFYVVPQKAEALSLTFQIQLIPLREADGKIEQITDNATLNALLRGHILFVLSRDGQQPIVVSISDGTFKITFDEAETSSPILLTLQWYWPNYLKDALDKQLLYGQAVRDWMLQADYTKYFFYDNAASTNEGIPVPEFLSDPNFDFNPDSNSDYGVYYDYFNNSDQYIGESVQYTLLQITAEETPADISQ